MNRGSSTQSPPARTTFSFYTEDLDAISELRRELRELGLRIDTVKAVRGVLHVTSESELLARSIIQYKADESKKAPREIEMVGSRLSVIIPEKDLRKLDNVVDELDLKRIKMNRSYVLRALLRSLPSVKTFYKPLANFTEEKTGGSRAGHQGQGGHARREEIPGEKRPLTLSPGVRGILPVLCLETATAYPGRATARPAGSCRPRSGQIRGRSALSDESAQTFSPVILPRIGL